MTTARPRRLDPDALAALEEERAFLLRSLDDLEQEYAVGDIDEADYETLKDDYTRRAAEVIRAVDEQRSAFKATKGVRSRQALVWLVGLALLGGLSGFLISRSSGARTGPCTGSDPFRYLAPGRKSDRSSKAPHDPCGAGGLSPAQDFGRGAGSLFDVPFWRSLQFTLRKVWQGSHCHRASTGAKELSHVPSPCDPLGGNAITVELGGRPCASTISGRTLCYGSTDRSSVPCPRRRDFRELESPFY